MCKFTWYYDPSTGRFISEDPIKDGLNWYVYCGNNPVMFVDPWGLAVTERDKVAYAAGVLSYDDIEQIKHYTEVYEEAKKTNDYVAMNDAHIAVAYIRTKYDSKYMYNDTYDYSHGGKLFSPYGSDNDTVKDEGWMIVAGAVGGTAIAKGGVLAAKIGTILSPSVPAIGQISQQTQNHIMQSHHEWGRVVSDPNSWSEVQSVVMKVVLNGTETAYGSALQKTMKIRNEIVVVTYKIVDGIVRISDGWVQTK